MGRNKIKISHDLALNSKFLTEWLKSIKSNIPLYESMIKDKAITSKIAIIKLKKMFDYNYHTRKINVIFNRIFK